MVNTRVMIMGEQPFFRAGVRQALFHEKDLDIIEPTRRTMCWG